MNKTTLDGNELEFIALESEGIKDYTVIEWSLAGTDIDPSALSMSIITKKKTKKFEVVGMQCHTVYEKVYFEVDASSPEDALALVKSNPDAYVTDTKSTDCADSEFIDIEEWEVR